MITATTHADIMTQFKAAASTQTRATENPVSATLLHGHTENVARLSDLLDSAYPSRLHEVNVDLQTVLVVHADGRQVTELLCDLTREIYALGVAA